MKFKYRNKFYKPNFLDGIYKLTKNYNPLDHYDTDEFDRLLALEYQKQGANIALNINFLSKELNLSHKKINDYLMWLYKKGKIILFSNGYDNGFYDKKKNLDKDLRNIYLIRLTRFYLNLHENNLNLHEDSTDPVMIEEMIN